MGRVLAVVAAIATVSSGCGLPRDPEGTLERVRGGTLRVGVAEHDPWVASADGEPTGAEVALAEDLAAGLDARIEWMPGSPAELLEALERRKLDLVIAGLVADDPWSQRVGFTKPYFTVRTLIGVEPGVPPPASPEGLRIGAEAGTDIPALVEDHGGIPVPVASLETATPPVAAAEWEIRSLGLQPTNLELVADKHVVAAPSGENAWIVYLERYLRSRLADIPRLLVEHAR